MCELVMDILFYTAETAASIIWNEFPKGIILY